MRRLIVSWVRILVDLFYRRVEVDGLANVPTQGPVLLVANHFNGLVDPMLVMAILDRPIVFVAKSTLWKFPILKTLLDALGVVPVYRRQDRDGSSPDPKAAEQGNEKSLAKLAGVLRSGGAVLIFPEGRSHSDPMISEIRTGAARMLLMSGAEAPVVPIGIWFMKKDEFRSDVLLRVGDPRVFGGEGATVDRITDGIRDALESVTLNAESWEGHEVVTAVDTLYGERLLEGPPGLPRSFETRRLLLEARETLARVAPKDIDRLSFRARAFDRLMRRAGLVPSQLDETRPFPRLFGLIARSLPFSVLGAPFALLGILAFYIPYRLCGIAARPFARSRQGLDQVALVKILTGVLTYPLFLAAEVALAFHFLGPVPAAVLAVLLPLCGLFAVRYVEAWQRGEGQARALLLQIYSSAFHPDALLALRRERDALREECDRLAELYRRTVDNSGI